MGSRSGSEGRRHGKKRRSQSRSPSFKRHKKSGRRHSRSYSRSPVRQQSRNVSSSSKKYKYKSPSRHHSKSRSPKRHSRSRSPRRRSKSRSPRRYSKSRSPRRHSKSRSPRRRTKSRSPKRRSNSKTPIKHSRSKSPKQHSKSGSPRRLENWSPVRYSSKSKSPSKYEIQSKSQGRHHISSKSKDKHSKQKEQPQYREPEINLSGFEDLTPSEQAKIRTKLGLSAVVSSDVALKEKEKNKALDIVDIKKSLLEQIERSKAIEAINSDDFIQQIFKSKQEGDNDKPEIYNAAIIGDPKIEVKSEVTTLINSDSIAHPNLYEDVAEKEERWFKKLIAMRQSILNKF